MKKRKIGKGGLCQLDAFRNELVRFLEDFEYGELCGDPYTPNVKILLKMNDSAKFRNILMQKNRDNRRFGDLYSTFLCQNNDRVVPKEFRIRVYHLVHFFYHGTIPLDEKLKSFSVLRKVEKEVLTTEYGQELSDFVSVELGDTIIPKDTFWEILRFIPHDYAHLCTIGLVNERFFTSFLLTWERLRILPKTLNQISLLVLKNCHQISLVHKISDEDDDGSGNRDTGFGTSKLKYLFSHITLRRIRKLDLSLCQNDDSYHNIFKYVFSQKIKFPSLQTLIFQFVPFTREYSNDGSKDEIMEPYKTKFRTQNFVWKYSVQELNFCPSLQHIINASVEDLSLFPPRILTNRIRTLKMYVYRKDARALTECGFEFSNCENFSLYPREILSSPYVQRVFEKIKFNKNELRELSVFVSSSENELIFSHDSMRNLESVRIDFLGHFVKHIHEFGHGGWWESFHCCRNPTIRFENSVKPANVEMVNYPIRGFIRGLRGNTLSFTRELIVDRIKMFIYHEKDIGLGRYCEWSMNANHFNDFYMENVSKEQSIHYFDNTVRFLVETHTIEVVLEGRDYLGLPELHFLASLGKGVEEGSRLSNFKVIRVIYLSPNSPIEQRRNLRKFIAEYFSCCEVSLEVEENGSLSRKKTSKKVKRKKGVLRGCKICISQIGEPDLTSIRENAVELGATHCPQFNESVTHLIVPNINAKKDKVVQKALKNQMGTFVVKKEWIDDCESDNFRCYEDDYRLFSMKQYDRLETREEEESEDEDDDPELYGKKGAKRFVLVLEIDRKRKVKKNKVWIDKFLCRKNYILIDDNMY